MNGRRRRRFGLVLGPLLLAIGLVAALLGGTYVLKRPGDEAPPVTLPPVSLTSSRSIESTASSSTSTTAPDAAIVAAAGSSDAVPNAGLALSATSTAPPKRGPGAVLKFDPKSAPRLPHGMSDEEYIASYYRALAASDWKRAFALVPKNQRGEKVADFAKLASAFPLKSFTILGAAPGVDAGILVVHVTPHDGVWNTVWRFADTKAGRVVRDLTYSRPGGAGCH